MVSFYVCIKFCPQQLHKVQVYQSPVYYVLCLPFYAEVLLNVRSLRQGFYRYIKTDLMIKIVPSLAIRAEAA